jgi:hypothetical protein
MRFCRARLVVALSAALIACRDEQPAKMDSIAIDPPVPPAAVVPPPNTGWDEEAAGPALLLSVADNSAAALVVIPSLTDSTIDPSAFNVDPLVDANVELFSRRGLSGSTVLLADSTRLEGCLSWPQVRLADIAPEPWRIGFVKGTVAPLPLDSLETMKSADSVLVTAELARMSSAVVEGDDPVFQGLPFTVRKAYRFTVGQTMVLAGDIVRKINEEANPREEHLLLVAERPSTGGSYVPVYQNRVAGKEDEVRTTEILGAVRFVKTKRPALVIALDYEDGGRVALLQRMSDREWQITWRSAYTDC